VNSLVHLLVLVATSFLLGCSDKNNDEAGCGKILFEQPMPVGFETADWSFFMGSYEIVGEPMILYMKLFAKKREKIVKLLTPCDMNKLTGVAIKNCDEAILFLRLFTNDKYYFIFDEPHAIEQQPESVIIIHQDNGFLVTRKLTVASPQKPHGYPVFEFQEKVTFDGKYKLISKKMLNYVPFDKYPFPVIY